MEAALMNNHLFLKWIGHACFLLDDGHCKVCFDPYKNGSVDNLIFPNGVNTNYLFVSHEHDDHNNREGVVQLLNKVEDLDVKIINIPHDNAGGKLRGMNKIHIVYMSNYKIVHFGDIGCELTNQMIEQLKDADLVLIPINGFFTIDYKQAYDIFKKINPHVLIPMHYYYNNTGYFDNNQIFKFISLAKNEITFIKDKMIDIQQYVEPNKSKILILDCDNLKEN